MPSYFKNFKSPAVLGEIDIYSFLDMVKNPKPERKEAILKAREYYNKGEQSSYNRLKGQLPCTTLNFTFSDWKNDQNIIAPTGFIYIDLDGTTELDSTNPLIFASWVSLSGNGKGILVKVENLSLDNFKDTYDAISKELCIESDNGASKATQFNVISYDSNLYVNNDSIAYEANVVINKNTPTTIAYNYKERKDATELGEETTLRYDNTEDIDFEGKDYIFYPNDKALFAKGWIPKRIPTGERNEMLSSLAYQFKGLNPKLPIKNLRLFIMNINRSRCLEPLDQIEVNHIVNKIAKMEVIEPFLNMPRRIVFNPKKSLSRRQKLSIANKLIGRRRSSMTIQELKDIVCSWDYNEHGKITQVKLAKVSGRNIKTIEKYYKNLKLSIAQINSKTDSS